MTLLLRQNGPSCALTILWAWWRHGFPPRPQRGEREKVLPCLPFCRKSLFFWDAPSTWLWCTFREAFPDGFRAGWSLTLQLSWFVFSWITQYCFSCPVCLNAFLHQDHWCSVEHQGKAVQEGGDAQRERAQASCFGIRHQWVALVMPLSFCEQRFAELWNHILRMTTATSAPAVYGN